MKSTTSASLLRYDNFKTQSSLQVFSSLPRGLIAKIDASRMRGKGRGKLLSLLKKLFSNLFDLIRSF